VKITDEVTSRRQVVFTRAEIREKLGVDLADFILASISFDDLTLTLTCGNEAVT
jgi:hypothetical protein